METEGMITELTYSPLAVLNLFNNAINLSQSRKLIQVRGVFIPGKGSNYSGYYYDSLRDEASDAQLTIIVPALIRGQLQAGKVIVLNGFVSKRVVNTASRIDIQLTITDLIGQTQHKYSEQEHKTIDLLQQKAAAGFRDVQYWVKDRILTSQPVRVGIIIGNNAIIDSDIKHQLRESIGFYDCSFLRVNLSSEEEIIAGLNQMETEGFDIVSVSRGGGENLGVFNKPAVAERAITLQPLFVTAIGHKEDVTLLQRVADKAFITPSEMGQFFNEVYNQTQEELQHSRAKLVESVTQQLRANYQKQIETLTAQIKGVEELKQKSIGDLTKVHEEKVAVLQAQIEQIHKANTELLQKGQRLQEEKVSLLSSEIASLKERGKNQEQLIANYKSQLATQAKPTVNWAAIIIAIILGIIIGLALHGK